jgi:hypothetical protein
MHGLSHFRLREAHTLSYLVFATAASQSLRLRVWSLEHEIHSNSVQFMPLTRHVVSLTTR